MRLLSSPALVCLCLCVLARSQASHRSLGDGISNGHSLSPLPVAVESLRRVLPALRRLPPLQQPSAPTHQFLALSRSSPLHHPRTSTHDPSWISLLVHFTAPVNSATLAALAEVASGAVTASVGSGVFAVLAPPDALNRIRSFPGLASVRLRSSADKQAAPLHSALYSNATAFSADSGRIHVHCRCTWPSRACASRIASVLRAHGCTVPADHAPYYKVMGACRAAAAAAASEAVAALAHVDWVEHAMPFASLDFSSKQIFWNQSASFFMNATYASALNGSGQIIAVADTGLDVSNCFFNYGQTITAANCNTRIDAGNLHTYWIMDNCQTCGQCPRACSDFLDLEGHGTHVAGIAAGRANPRISGGSVAAAENGLAHGASLYFQDISASSGIITPPIDLQELFAPAYAAGARVHSNSWGCSASKPSDCNRYSLSAYEVDAFTANHKDFLVVFAAGNAGRAGGSVIGTVGSPATCKNCLSVGSTNLGVAGAAHNWRHTSTLDACKPRYGSDKDSLLSPCCTAASATLAAGANCSLSALLCCPWDGHTVCCSEEAAQGAKPKLSFLTLSDFSSVGPTQDGRFKPDVVAPGHMIASANARDVFESDGSSTQCAPPPPASATNVNWRSRAVQLMSGTSMSAPAVAAVAAIVRQWFQEGWYPEGSPASAAPLHPSSALIRAVIAASAVSLDSPHAAAAPSAQYGFGLPSLARALYIKAAGGSSRIAVVDSSSVPHGGSAAVSHGAHNVVTARCSGGPVHVALAWSDLPGHPSATLQLVNDLDLLVWSKVDHASDPVLLYGNGAAIADSRNNLETVSTSCLAGSNLTVAVYGAIVLSPLQLYALVISGAIVQSSLAATDTQHTVRDAAASGRSVLVTHHDRTTAAPLAPHRINY